MTKLLASRLVEASNQQRMDGVIEQVACSGQASQRPAGRALLEAGTIDAKRYAKPQPVPI